MTRLPRINSIIGGYQRVCAAQSPSQPDPRCQWPWLSLQGRVSLRSIVGDRLGPSPGAPVGGAARWSRRSVRGHGDVGGRAVAAGPAGAHGVAQVPADQRLYGLDPVDRSADRLSDRQPGPLAVVGEGPDPAGEAGGGGQVPRSVSRTRGGQRRPPRPGFASMVSRRLSSRARYCRTVVRSSAGWVETSARPGERVRTGETRQAGRFVIERPIPARTCGLVRPVKSNRRTGK